MSDWPNALTNSTPGYYSANSVLLGMITNNPATIAWPLTNKAFFLPFRVAVGCVAYKITFGCGATAGGNVDVGIYTREGVKLVSSGSTARVASSEVTADITNTYLGRGTYYMAMSVDGTSNMFCVTPGSLQKARLYGVVEMASAFALPATATFAAVGTAIIPTMVIHTVTNI